MLQQTTIDNIEYLNIKNNFADMVAGLLK